MAEQIYIKGIYINEHVFADGGNVIKLSIPEKELIDLFKQFKANLSDGRVKLLIKKSKNPITSKSTGKVVATHYMTVDTWKPDPKDRPESAPKPKIEEDDVPF